MEQLVEEMKQVATQCTTEVAVVQVELSGLHEKIFAPLERLEGESPCFCWGPIRNGSSGVNFGVKRPSFGAENLTFV